MSKITNYDYDNSGRQRAKVFNKTCVLTRSEQTVMTTFCATTKQRHNPTLLNHWWLWLLTHWVHQVLTRSEQTVMTTFCATTKQRHNSTLLNHWWLWLLTHWVHQVLTRSEQTVMTTFCAMTRQRHNSTLLNHYDYWPIGFIRWIRFS